MCTIISYRPADPHIFPTFILSKPVVDIHPSTLSPTSRSTNHPSLPSCQLVQFTHHFACLVDLAHAPHHKAGSKIRWYYGDPYLLTNPLATILALDLLLDHRIVRRPPIRPRDDEKRQRNDKQPDDLADEFPIQPQQRSSVHLPPLLSPNLHDPLKKHNDLSFESPYSNIPANNIPRLPPPPHQPSRNQERDER